MQPTAGDHDFMIYAEATGRDVALVRDFNEPNAHLIAAAPELLHALQQLNGMLLPGPKLDIVRAALAKAGMS